MLVAHKGLFRIGELLRVRVQDVFWRKGTAIIRIPWAKTGREQNVRISDAGTTELLRKLIEACRDPADFIAPFSYSQLRSFLRFLLSRVGLNVPRFTLHSFRHGGASEMALAGTPVEIVANLGRWKLLASALHYIQTGTSLLAVVSIPEPHASVARALAHSWPV